jgi:hypothetical protein
VRREDPVRPIRTRGAIRTRSVEGEPPGLDTAGRTRGAVRTRGVIPTTSLAECVAISALIEKLREENNGCPLSVVVYGWGSNQANEFVNKLLPHVWPGDGLILIPSKRSVGVAAPVPQDAVLLDWNRPTDRRIYNNGHLAGGIVFCESQECRIEELRNNWKNFARAVIMPKDDPKAQEHLSAAEKGY